MERFKAMRKWFVLLLMCMSCSTLPSCSDDDNDMRDVAVSPERLPKVSKDFLSEYYHGVKISSVVIDYDDNVMVYDVDLANPELIPAGFSAVRDNHLILFVEAEHAMGDYVELEFHADL